MPITLPASLATHLAGECTTLATLWEVARKDGQVFRYTDHDQPITFNGNVYKPGVGYDRSAIEDKGDMSSDNLNITGNIRDGDISQADIRSGRFDRSRVKISVVDYTNPTAEIIRRVGNLGELKQSNTGQFETELRGLSDALYEEFRRVYTPGCQTDLGSKSCRRFMEPPLRENEREYELNEEVSIAGNTTHIFRCITAGKTADAATFNPADFNVATGATVTDGEVEWEARLPWKRSVTVFTPPPPAPGPNRRTFRAMVPDVNLTADATYYTGGLIVFDTGDNAGFSREIKASVEVSPGELEFTTFLRFPFDVADGDTFTVYPGCAKTLAVCAARFANSINFQGFPYVPGNDFMTANHGRG